MNDFYSRPQPGTMPDKPSDWLIRKLAEGLARPESIIALEGLNATGKSSLCVNVTFSKDSSAVEDYTCDKCRELHMAGLNVAVFAFGRDSAAAEDEIHSPVDLMEWAAVLISVGLCHDCFIGEGYPPSALSDLDEGFVQHAVRIMEAPGPEVIA